MMNRIIAIFLLAIVPQCLIAKVNVLACEPEWAALAEEIGKHQVVVTSATTASQNAHHIQARPSLIAKARNAQLLFCSGADLEVGWLPILLRKSGNPHIQPRAEGYLMAANYVQLLDKPQELDRSHGDVHAQGNPHVHLDPRNILIIAKVLRDKLLKIAPEHAQFYQNNYVVFEQKWRQAMARWEKDIVALSGQPIVVYHRSWTYLVNWLNLVEVVSIEPKPGIPPSSKHLKTLIRHLQAHPAKAIIFAHNEEARAPNWLAEKTHIPAIELPFTIGGSTPAQDLVSLFDEIIARLQVLTRND